MMRRGLCAETEWFDVDLPWDKRDGMEVTTYRRSAGL
eukprot:COSAG04_NODE_1276_length_7440_cov_3.885710_8_plen_37_part_00